MFLDVTVSFSNMDAEIQTLTNKCVFRRKPQWDVRLLAPASNYVPGCFVLWTVLNDLITVHSAIVKLGEAAEHLIDGSKKGIHWLSF